MREGSLTTASHPKLGRENRTLGTGTKVARWNVGRQSTSKIGRSLIVKDSIRDGAYFVLNSTSNREPMQVVQKGRGTLSFRDSKNETSSMILHFLESVQQVLW